ncbi:DUF6221 family protein [Streptomyces rubiginosohelvolus]|uniref:DUF6221 family protein n=1 Tax=Streptomyces rubiginosohelvolus TaxID=67362 RepID=UPI003F903989
MTAQGEDILAYLDRAISATESVARSAADAHGPTWNWGADGEVTGGTRFPDGGFMSEGALQAKTPAEAEHAALHDPESVLRRCSADRKLIAEHGPCSDQDLGCKGCGFNNQEESMVDHYEDCPVLCALAEGYGWTEGER